MQDRYSPPRAPLQDVISSSQAKLGDVVIVAVLLFMWLLDFPHDALSMLIGRHFPWPVTRPLKWPALLVERTLIESAVCIPAALLLGLRVRRYAVPTAVLLAVMFSGKIVMRSVGSAHWGFLLFVAGIHTALLVGLTAYLAKRGSGRVSMTAQVG